MRDNPYELAEQMAKRDTDILPAAAKFLAGVAAFLGIAFYLARFSTAHVLWNMGLTYAAIWYLAGQGYYLLYTIQRRKYQEIPPSDEKAKRQRTDFVQRTKIFFLLACILVLPAGFPFLLMWMGLEGSPETTGYCWSCFGGIATLAFIIRSWKDCPHCFHKIRANEMRCPHCKTTLRKWYDD